MSTGQGEDARAVGIAVLTFHRNDSLLAALPELDRQAAAVDRPARVIVVDNDPAAGAREAVAALALPLVVYVHEPRPGIAAARNAALDAAADLELLAFLDDDERPSPGWFAALLDAHRTLGGAAIAGAVPRLHEVTPAPWVREARVFDRRRLPTGTPVEAASTANLLLDLDFLRHHGLRFDDRLGLSGGSDHLLTRQIRRVGGDIYWCDEAVVEDLVPAERLTGRWVLRRGYRTGGTSVIVATMLAPSRPQAFAARARGGVAGAVRVLGGTARALIGLVRRSPEQVGRGAWSAARGAGMVGAALGHRVVEYRRAP